MEKVPVVNSANIFLRTAERVMIQVGRFKATTFEELFQGIKNLPWEEYIPEAVSYTHLEDRDGRTTGVSAVGQRHGRVAKSGRDKR